MDYPKNISDYHIQQLHLPKDISEDLVGETLSDDVSLADEKLITFLIDQNLSTTHDKSRGHLHQAEIDIQDDNAVQNKGRATRLIKNIKNEFYLLLCTDHPTYRNLRSKFSVNFEQLVPIIAAAIATSLGITASMIVGVVAAVLITLFKIPKNAWCRTLSDSR